MNETTLYGKTFKEIGEIITWWMENAPPTADELISENLKLRGKVAFYESRIQQMSDAMGKRNG